MADDSFRMLLLGIGVLECYVAPSQKLATVRLELPAVCKVTFNVQSTQGDAEESGSSDCLRAQLYM